jgi:hypothetical protein
MVPQEGRNGRIPEQFSTTTSFAAATQSSSGRFCPEDKMLDELTDRHALLARTEALGREIEELSNSADMTPGLRHRIAEMKILHQEMTARLQALDRLQ